MGNATAYTYVGRNIYTTHTGLYASEGTYYLELETSFQHTVLMFIYVYTAFVYLHMVYKSVAFYWIFIRSCPSTSTYSNKILFVPILTELMLPFLLCHGILHTSIVT